MARGRTSLSAVSIRRDVAAHGDLRSAVHQGWAHLRVSLIVGLTAVVDIGPPQLRFGIGHEARRRLWTRPLISVPDIDTGASESAAGLRGGGQQIERESAPVVLLVTRSLGIGGVESIVAALARGMRSRGLHPIVLCETGGATADSLALQGVDLVVAPDEASAEAALARLPVVQVAELHNAPDHLIGSCRSRGIPLVRVQHTTNVNVSPTEVARETALTRQTARTIAVSRTVADSCAAWFPEGFAPPVVVPNGITAFAGDQAFSADARRALGAALSCDLDNEVVFCCLARYDSPKNLSGVVSAFLEAASSRPDMRLVIAGPVQDWLEYALADAVRASHRAGHRVHLLGSSSSRVLMAAADFFLLGSFFEGWPVAATEAACTGLPLIVTEVGGARELVGDGGERGWLVSNPAAAAGKVDDPAIARARRRVLAQRNRDELVAAMSQAHAQVEQWRARRPVLAESASRAFSSDLMVERHAEVLAEVLAEATSAAGVSRVP